MTDNAESNETLADYLLAEEQLIANKIAEEEHELAKAMHGIFLQTNMVHKLKPSK